MPGLLKNKETLFVEKFLNFFNKYDAVYFDQCFNFDSLLSITSYDAECQSITINMNNRSHDDYAKIACFVPIFYQEFAHECLSFLLNWFDQTIIIYLTDV
jgi:hypothetical protein